MLRALLALLCLYVLGPAAAKAHEFWIEPQAYEIAPGEPIVARLRNGERFNGVALPYLPAGYRRFELIEGAAARPVEARLGDEPALNMPAAAEGLAIVALETTDSILTYDDPERFRRFVAHKDLAGALEAHARRGLPEAGFSERYSRHVKALVAVGAGMGADRALGLRTEIVALANPYTDDLSAGLPLQVFFEGAPRAGAQVELFARGPEGEVTITLHRTDAEGRVTVPVAPGHAYFADAVVLLDTGNDRPEAGPVWQSLWAGLSFAVPARAP
ncbi:MAG: DUF4198 domain-containing protein [Paracoccaceae bacterium]|nr:DUF4198 domain-containing protein [Paracoccaceae bacterium]